MNRGDALALIVFFAFLAGVGGFVLGQYYNSRFRAVQGYSWAIDGHTGQLCDPWPATYDTAIKDREGIPYCARIP